MEIKRFWAKTTDDAEKHENAFHPLVCHLIDVGAAALVLWNDVLPEEIKKRLARAFKLENDLEKAGLLIAFLIGLHDLGKCSPPFALRGQNEVRNKNSLNETLKRHSRKSFYGKKVWGKLQTIELLMLYKNTDCYCEISKSTSDAPHNFVTSVILPPILKDKFNFPEKLAENVAEIIGGHHGTFPDSNYLNNSTSDSFCGDEHWRTAQREIVETLAEVFGIDGDFSNIPNQKLDNDNNATAMIFAGLTTVADWIGSNTDFFKCKIEDSRKVLDENFEWFDLADYFNESKQKAAEALEKLGWGKWVKETNEKKFKELFPVIKVPRHLQDMAVKIADEPEFNSIGIAVVESPTGEGKTEAAMFLADIWNAKLGTRGIYFALPTQATSNQMFGRIAEFLEARFKDEDVNVQLMLQHGHASISDAFIERRENFQNIQNIFNDADKSDGFLNVAAAEWFTYKKRGLLVPFGVGTIDQILLAVLQTKHVFVRLFGLANKTVIIDEVHAYDAYMSTLLERLLEWLAALGSPVVILSATLPKNKRDSLIKAYLKGLEQFKDGENLINTGEKDEYPRISYATKKMPEKTFRVCGLKTSDQNTKTLCLEWKDEDNFVNELKEKLIDGGCAAIICNTVDKAQTLYTTLSDDKFFQGEASDGEPKLDLLHARFRYKDRELIEERSLKRFGKPNKDEKSLNRPHTAILISTQIIEQSLDLDFDLMISELAPADLLLQRAGRLQRHERDRFPAFKVQGKAKATLWLIKPPTDANGDLFVEKNSPDFGVSGIIYDKHILLRSWLRLKDKTKIEIPTDVEELIEDVYNSKLECFDERYLSVWDETKYRLDTKLSEKKIKAKAVYLTDFDDDDFYDSFNFQLDENDPEKHKTLRAHTRDEERPTVSIVLLTQSEANQINLEAEPNRETSEFLIRREVKISKGGLTQNIIVNPDFKVSNWEKSALLRHHRLIVLDEQNQKIIGKKILILDDEKGVEYKTAGGESE